MMIHSSKRNFMILFKLATSCIFIGYVLLKIDWPTIFNSLKKIEFIYYFASFLLFFISIVLLGYRSYLFFKDTIISHSMISLTKFHFISFYYNLFATTGGKEAIKWYKITRDKGGHTVYLASTIFERSIHIYVILLSILIPLFFYYTNTEIINFRNDILPILLILLICMTIIIAYFIIPAFQSFILNYFIKFVPNQGKRQKFIQFLKNVSTGNRFLDFFTILLTLNILGQLIFYCRMFLLFQALGIHLGIISIIWMSSLVLLIQMLPISFSGIGVNESAYAYLFTLFNLPIEEGILISILLLSQRLIISMIGGILEWIEN